MNPIATKALPPKLVARRLNVSVATLKKWRKTGEGPQYVQVGQLVRYPEESLAQWLRGHELSEDETDDR